MKKAYEDASAILRQNAMKSTDAFGKGVDGPAVTPSRGSKDGLSGAEVKVTGAVLSAGGELSVKSQETNDLKATTRKRASWPQAPFRDPPYPSCRVHAFFALRSRTFRIS